MEILNRDNAKTARVIIDIEHPEEGSKKFTYNGQSLNNGSYISTIGQKILPECEYKFYQVLS